MRLQSLNHLIEVVRAVARPTRIVVLGSSLLRGLLRLGIIETTNLRQHYQATSLGEREATTAGRNLQIILRELGEA